MDPELNGPEQEVSAESGEPARAVEPAPPAEERKPDSQAGQGGQAEAVTEAESGDDSGLTDEAMDADASDASDTAGEAPACEDAESTQQAGPAPEVTTEQVVEAVLFGADTPLTPAKIVAIVGTGSARDVRKHIETLNQRYEQTGASFRIAKIAGGYQMLTLPAFNPWLKRLKQTRQESKLSQAAMETLAVVAYKQPVVRAEIEAIRGVATGEMLNRLRELGLVKIVGRAEDVGRPLLYGTTKRFLDVFGLGSLEDLPTVEELKAPE